MSEGLYNKLLAGKPLDAGKPEVVTGFIFIAGLLYMGMYIASSFSTQMAQRMALVGSALPLTLGSGAIGFAGRNTIGRSAAALAKMEAKRGKDLNLRAANLGDTPEAKRLQSLAASAGKRAEQLEKLSGRKFNPLDTGAGKALTKAFNITGGSTKNTQSFAEMIKSRENAANKTAAKVAPDKKVMEQAMKEAGQKAGEAVRKEMAGSIQDAKNAHAANTQGHTEERKVAVQERDAAQRRVKDEEAKFLQMQSNKSGNLAQQKRIIEAAQIEARHANEAAEQKLAQIDAKWTPTLQKSQDAIVKLQKEEGEKIKKAIEHSNHEFHESLESTERAVARKTGTFLQRAVDPITGDAKQIGDAVVKHTRKHHKEENMKSLLAQFANKDGNGEAH
jgi:hypothetical protein